MKQFFTMTLIIGCAIGIAIGGIVGINHSLQARHQEHNEQLIDNKKLLSYMKRAIVCEAGGITEPSEYIEERLDTGGFRNKHVDEFDALMEKLGRRVLNEYFRSQRRQLKCPIKEKEEKNQSI